jgi:GntR family transcriptional regulator
MVRLRTADEVPMAVERSYIPVQVAPGLDDVKLTDTSLYAILEDRFGIELDHGEQTIEAGIVDPDDAALLELRPGSAVLLVERRASAEGRPVELTVSAYRGDRYQLHVGLDARQRARLTDHRAPGEEP